MPALLSTRLNKQDCDDTYVSWCASTLASTDPANRVMVAQDDAGVCCFLTMRLHEDARLELVLSGVDESRPARQDDRAGTRLDQRRRHWTLQVWRAGVRSELGIAPGAVVFLFLARLTRVKGILNMKRGFAGIEAVMPHAQFLIVGPDEEHLMPILEQEWAACAQKIHCVSCTQQPERYMSAADVFCLPCNLEGFSSANIQAPGAGLPAIVSHIYGLTDAVKSGVPGIFHATGDIAQMQKAMLLLYNDEHPRRQMGEAAQRRAYQDFSQDVIVEAMRKYHQKIIGGEVRS